MTNPSDDRKNRDNEPIFMNVLPERLSSLSASELADEMELALDYMTEETYDPAVISAYLDAIDAKAPMPEYPDAETAYAELCRRMAPAEALQRTNPEPIRPRRILRRGIKTSLVAAMVVVCLFSGMVVVQASGVDVFGAIARWTESVFTFSGSNSRENDDYPSNDENIPAEYKELQAVLHERGMSLFVPAVPEDFVVDESTLFIQPNYGSIFFDVMYTRENDYIEYSVIETTEITSTNYEKDSNDIESFEYNEVLYYVFQNNKNAVIVWSIDEFEYSLSTNLPSEFLKYIIQSDN